MRFLRSIVRATVAVAAISAASGGVAPALAQDTLPVAQDIQAPQTAPAHISYAEGAVTITHGNRAATGVEGQSEAVTINMPVVEGDRIVTGRDGRAEIMFSDGSAIAIEPGSDVEMIGPARVRVIAGAIEHRPATPVDPRSPSAQNLPPDLQPYGPDLDQNGSWQYEPQYGNVWYPTTVSASWQPYYDGYWYSAPVYGYTWVGHSGWAWPTHHYGRWGHAHNRWFWIPGHAYSSAWVSWGSAPGYVGWCPLGWDNRAVVAFSQRSDWRGTDPRWTFMSRDQFGYRGYTPQRNSVNPATIGNVAFVEHRRPPSRERRGTLSVGGSNDRTNDAVGVAVPRYRQREAGTAGSPNRGVGQTVAPPPAVTTPVV